MDNLLKQLLDLSHALGDPAQDWAILGEGNTSAVQDEDVFLVKASGSNLQTLMAEQVTAVRFAPLQDALESDRDFSDAETKNLLLAACVGAHAPMPSVETLLHAYLLTLENMNFIGHTHVTSINGLLCSNRGWDAMQRGGRLFPDEIVVCGIAPCCVPYVDPGLPLARALRREVTEYAGRYGVPPKTIYLQNHGFIALGKTPREVIQITLMADKAARILSAALACGQPSFLSPEAVARINTRPDEHFRQKALGQDG
jgi:rhamnose utilization protein RhaD (predicted bifunctional aldolase and dehydrogenase)